MSFEDFIYEFQCMENCNLGPEVLNEISEMTSINERNIERIGKWSSFSANGQWVRSLYIIYFVSFFSS